MLSRRRESSAAGPDSRHARLMLNARTWRARAGSSAKRMEWKRWIDDPLVRYIGRVRSRHLTAMMCAEEQVREIDRTSGISVKKKLADVGQLQNVHIQHCASKEGH